MGVFFQCMDITRLFMARAAGGEDDEWKRNCICMLLLLHLVGLGYVFLAVVFASMIRKSMGDWCNVIAVLPRFSMYIYIYTPDIPDWLVDTLPSTRIVGSYLLDKLHIYAHTTQHVALRLLLCPVP